MVPQLPPVLKNIRQKAVKFSTHMLLLTVYKSPEDTTQYPKCTSGMTGITSCYRLLEKILENLELKKWLLDKIIPAWSSVQTTGVAS